MSREALSFLPYTELINKEAEVIGVSDSRVRVAVADALRAERAAHLSESALRFVDLDAAQINAALDARSSTDHVRTVIVPRR